MLFEYKANGTKESRMTFAYRPFWSDERSFDREAPPYQKVLDESDYNYRLKLAPPPPFPPRTGHRRNRERNILWFNSPFSESVSTNIGKKFLALVDRCFPRGHTLNKIFNLNTINRQPKQATSGGLQPLPGERLNQAL